MGAIRTGEAVERVFALLLTCFENLVHGAIIFGWPSFVFVFNQRGYFNDLCNADGPSENTTSSMIHNISTGSSSPIEVTDNDMPCPEQATRLQLVFSVASASQTISMFPIGLFFDRFGTRISRLVMSFLMLIGYLMMALSSPSYSFLLFPATVCFTVGGVILLLSSMQIGNLFGRNKSTVITIINAMYSASIIMSVIAKRSYEAGFSISTFFFILTGSVLLLSINTFVFLPTKFIPWPLPRGYTMTPCLTPPTTNPDKGEAACYQNRGYGEDPSSSNDIYLEKSRAIDGGTIKEVPRSEDGECLSQNRVDFRERAWEMGKTDKVASDRTASANGNCEENKGDYISSRSRKEVDPSMNQCNGGIRHVLENGLSEQNRGDFSSVEVGGDMHEIIGGGTGKRFADEIDERKRKEYGNLGSCLWSMPFFLLLLWQAFLEIDMIFTIGTLNFFLTRMADGDEDIVSWYIDAFSFIQFLVLIVGPLGGLLMDRNNVFTSCSRTRKPKLINQYADMRDSCLPLALATLASIGYSICLLIPSLQLQYLTFVFLLIVPSLLFGIGPAVVGIVFPMQYFASVYGAMRTISGLFSFLQYPIFILVQKYLDNDPFYVTVGFIVADILTLILPVALYVKSRQQLLGIHTTTGQTGVIKNPIHSKS
ncbi:solute carrier family 43 member 3-like [Lytechinus variegatus]|uniref:solute carrier family 43 member 3-like n=1 Tax=Lytechinus variegatus TaxID=7654 RepID=UPI001BB1E470|nr:solute carrier family 43 member 3-like [Lytechinus variegatus]